MFENSNLYVVTFLGCTKEQAYALCDDSGRVYGHESSNEAEAHVKHLNIRERINSHHPNWSHERNARVKNIFTMSALEQCFNFPLEMEAVTSDAGSLRGIKLNLYGRERLRAGARLIL